MKNSIKLTLAATAFVAFTSSYALAADTNTTTGAGVSAGVGVTTNNGTSAGVGVNGSANTSAGANTNSGNTNGGNTNGGNSNSNGSSSSADAGGMVLGTGATANASPDAFAQMAPDKRDSIKRICSDANLTEAVKNDCLAYGVLK